MFHERTTHAAKGKWRGILMTLGLPENVLRNKHGPCPLCGGVDRFRWDNIEGKGTYICSQCGAGDGMKLAIEFMGQPFPHVAAQIDAILNNVKPDAPSKIGMSEDDQRQALRRAWTESRPVVPGDLAHRYLTTRGVEELIYPKALRFSPAMRDGEGGMRPCMLAMVGRYGEERFVSMHRTFLRPDGNAKAEMAAPRKMMPGVLPEGACVMLSEYNGGPLGIAEGIETAMSASALYNLPVWSAINSAMLKKWMPPENCDEVAIFADNDLKFGGQAAAYHLAHRLNCKGIFATVHVPDKVGEDFNDIWIRKVGNSVTALR